LRVPVSTNLEGVPVSVALALMLPTAASIVVAPSETPVAVPVPDTVATFVADEVQLAFALILLWLPSATIHFAEQQIWSSKWGQ
jgi:hypothetical protein